MKKIFTTLAATLLMSTASFAAITVTHEGNPVSNGDTFTVYADQFTTTTMGPLHRIKGEVELNVSTTSAPLTFKLTTDNEKVQCCPEQCISVTDPDGDGLWEGSLTLSGNTTSVRCPIDITFVQQSATLPTFLITADVTISDKSGDTFKVRVIFDSEHAGVGSITSVDGISYSAGALRYNFAAPTNVAVYSIAGNQVLSRTVSGNGSIDLGTLHRGIYIYNAGGTTGKFVVR